MQENAAPEVRKDLVDFFRRLVPENAGYLHANDGPDDMPAHLKAALTPSGLTIPVIDARLQLGTWQGVFLLEHRAQPHRRVRSLDHRVDAEHDLGRVELQNPAGLGADRAALVFGYQRRRCGCIPRSCHVQLRHSLASTVVRRAAGM